MVESKLARIINNQWTKINDAHFISVDVSIKKTVKLIRLFVLINSFSYHFSTKRIEAIHVKVYSTIQELSVSVCTQHSKLPTPLQHTATRSTRHLALQHSVSNYRHIFTKLLKELSNYKFLCSLGPASVTGMMWVLDRKLLKTQTSGVNFLKQSYLLLWNCYIYCNRKAFLCFPVVVLSAPWSHR